MVGYPMRGRRCAAPVGTAHCLARENLACGRLPAQKNGWVLWEQQGQGAPMVIINPHAFPVRCVVQANITVAGVMDAAGQPVACQQVRGPQTNGTDKHNTIFTASVPALGHATYYLDKDMPCPAPAGGLRCGL